MWHVEELGARWLRWAGPAAMVGGALWMPYGAFEMIEPWGTDAVYREDKGYQVVTDAALFLFYGLPGSLALLLTTVGLLGVTARLGLPMSRLGRVGHALAYVALGLSLASSLGGIALVGPVHFGGLFFGSLALGAATFLTALDAHQAGAPGGWAVGLLVLGVVGLLLLPLRPMVNAVEVVPAAAGAAFIALFGLGWTPVGYRLWREQSTPDRRQTGLGRVARYGSGD